MISHPFFCESYHFTVRKHSFYYIIRQLSHPKSIAFTGQKLPFFYAFLQPTTDYQTVTTLRRFRCTRPAGNNFEILQGKRGKERPPIGHFGDWVLKNESQYTRIRLNTTHRYQQIKFLKKSWNLIKSENQSRKKND